MKASHFGCGAGHQLAITAAKAGWELEDFGTLQKSEAKCRAVLQYLRGEADLVLKAKPTSTLEPEVIIDPIIRVDRSVRPSYPNWVSKVMHPELENAGPTEYDITNVARWFCAGQKTGMVSGHLIYEKLKKKNNLLLKTCLGLRDLEEIQKKGIVFFRKYFNGMLVYGWSGVVMFRGGDIHAPYLMEDTDDVVLGWSWLTHSWCGNNPALRHSSQTKHFQLIEPFHPDPCS